MAGQFTSPFGSNANPFGVSAQPGNAIGMHRVIEEEETDVTGVASLSSTGQFSGDASVDTSSAARGPPVTDSYPAQYNFGRRTSVSAESLKPSAEAYDNWSPPVHDKTPKQMERLKHAIQGNFLFSHLDEEQSAQILGALVEKPIPAKGIKVCLGSPRRSPEPGSRALN